MTRKLLSALAAIAALLLVLALGARLASARREASTYDVALANLPIPTDPESLAEGERLFVSRGCAGADCHTADGGGHVTLQDRILGTIVASNLTHRARGFDGSDWDRAVRHGLHENGRSLVFMPSADFAGMPDRELARIAAYVRSLPRQDRALPSNDLGLVLRTLDLADAVPLFPASRIDHTAVAQPDPPAGRTVEHGAYLARTCVGCHGPRFSGGAIPGAPPELGEPRNLTFHASGLAGWSEQAFVRAMREGRTPDGGSLDPAQMPWRELGRMTDDELGALYVYLKSLPRVAEGHR